MADNILSAIIRVQAPGIQQVTNTVSTAVSKTEQSFKKLAPVTNQATQSLVNLSRVAQDAPYGFLGIANNLNPLLESFQRLKVSTGSTGGALKALGASLTGAGGLGLALGVVSSLLVVFGDRLFGGSKAANAAKQANEELAKSISGDLTKLTVLVGLIQNVNTSREDQAKALQLVNQEYAKHLPNLEKEGITLQNISASYDLITNSILKQAVVKGLQKEIADSIETTAAAIIKLQKAEEIRRIASEQANGATKDTKTNLDKAAEGYRRYTGTVKDGQIAQQGQRLELKKGVAIAADYETRVSSLTETLKKQLAPLLNLTSNFDDLGSSLNKPITIKPTSLKVKPDKIEIERPALGSIQIELPTAFDIEPENISRFKGQLREIENSLNFKIPVTLDLSSPGKSFQNAQKGNAGDVAALFKKQQEDAKAFADVITGTLTPAFQSFFATVQGGGNAFKAFAQAAVQALTQLITKLITTAVLAVIVTAITGGGTAIGASSNKFGDVFKFLAGFGGARASGGPVSSGKGYLVGENGPEFFSPSANGSIIPNHQLGGGYSGGGFGGGGGSVVFRVVGKDLIGVLANGKRSQNRLV